MKDRLKTIVVAAAPALLVLTAGAPAAAQDNTIRIGITLRMIVENGLKYGQMSKDELEAVNATGGINGKKIEVILLDDECKPDKGVANVNRFIHQHKVHLVMGSTCSSVSLPMVDITAKEEGAADRAALDQRQSITKKGSAWVFRTSVSERFYAAVHAKYLSENVGKKVAYLYTTDGAGDRLRQGLHGLHAERPTGGAALCDADAGDGSRFPLAPAQDQVAQPRRCSRSAARRCDRPHRAAVLRGRHPDGRCVAWSPHRPRPTRPCPNSPATRPWA